MIWILTRNAKEHNKFENLKPNINEEEKIAKYHLQTQVQVSIIWLSTAQNFHSSIKTHKLYYVLCFESRINLKTLTSDKHRSKSLLQKYIFPLFPWQKCLYYLWSSDQIQQKREIQGFKLIFDFLTWLQECKTKFIQKPSILIALIQIIPQIWLRCTVIALTIEGTLLDYLN